MKEEGMLTIDEVEALYPKLAEIGRVRMYQFLDSIRASRSNGFRKVFIKDRIEEYFSNTDEVIHEPIEN